MCLRAIVRHVCIEQIIAKVPLTYLNIQLLSMMLHVVYNKEVCSSVMTNTKQNTKL